MLFRSLAAKAGLAPPTGKMIRWVVKSYDGRVVNRWGYETALADTSKKARVKATILSCPQITKWYTDYVHDHRCKMFSVSSMESFLNEAEELLFETANGQYFSQFSCASHTTVAGSLRHRLMKIDLTGTQYDNIVPVKDDGDDWNIRLGRTVTANDDMVMSNDLHRGNIGLWKGNAVVIDFGYHLAVPEYRHGDMMPTIPDDWYAKEAA